MVKQPQILTAKVMHKRLYPKENAFQYGVYYYALPLPAPKIPGLLVKFHATDLGKRDGSDPTIWARKILTDYGLNKITKNIVLITMPRVMGYIFNPVSFYMCLDQNDALRAVLCEVHNTFGEQHSYVCAHSDHRPIEKEDWLEAEKVFHVSPFLERVGSYKFRFHFRPDKFAAWINYHDGQDGKQLLTSLIGDFTPLTKTTIRKAFWKHPMVSLKAMSLIHWQALRLVWRRIRYIPKPQQKDEKITASRNLTKK